MIIFFYGPDTYTRKEKVKEIIEEYKKHHQSGLNFIKISFTGDGTSFEEQGLNGFKRATKTVSMFDEKKLIVIEDIFSQNEQIQEELVNYLKNKNIYQDKDLIVLILAEKIDSRGKLFKFLKNKAKVQKFELLNPSQLRKWVKDYVGQKNRKIDENTIDLLIKHTGNNLWRISRELDKLSAFKDQRILQEDVEKLVKPEIEIDIFKTIDALGNKNKEKALRLLNDHFKKGDTEAYLLNRFVYQFRNLIKIKSFLEIYPEMRSYREMALKLGLHPFVIKKSISQARNFKLEDLKKIYHKLFAIDLDIKLGKINAKTALEMFIINL